MEKYVTLDHKTSSTAIFVGIAKNCQNDRFVFYAKKSLGHYVKIMFHEDIW